MHFISWFVMIGILVGGLITKQYMSVLAASIGMGLCSVADGLYYIAKMNNKEGTNNDKSGNN